MTGGSDFLKAIHIGENVDTRKGSTISIAEIGTHGIPRRLSTNSVGSSTSPTANSVVAGGRDRRHVCRSITIRVIVALALIAIGVAALVFSVVNNSKSSTTNNEAESTSPLVRIFTNQVSFGEYRFMLTPSAITLVPSVWHQDDTNKRAKLTIGNKQFGYQWMTFIAINDAFYLVQPITDANNNTMESCVMISGSGYVQLVESFGAANMTFVSNEVINEHESFGQVAVYKGASQLTFIGGQPFVDSIAVERFTTIQGDLQIGWSGVLRNGSRYEFWYGDHSESTTPDFTEFLLPASCTTAVTESIAPAVPLDNFS